MGAGKRDFLLTGDRTNLNLNSGKPVVKTTTIGTNKAYNLFKGHNMETL